MLFIVDISLFFLFNLFFPIPRDISFILGLTVRIAFVFYSRYSYKSENEYQISRNCVCSLTNTHMSTYVHVYTCVTYVHVYNGIDRKDRICHNVFIFIFAIRKMW